MNSIITTNFDIEPIEIWKHAVKFTCSNAIAIVMIRVKEKNRHSGSFAGSIEVASVLQCHFWASYLHKYILHTYEGQPKSYLEKATGCYMEH